LEKGSLPDELSKQQLAPNFMIAKIGSDLGELRFVYELGLERGGLSRSARRIPYRCVDCLALFRQRLERFISRREAAGSERYDERHDGIGTTRSR
jgi:hypothetical protein